LEAHKRQLRCRKKGEKMLEMIFLEILLCKISKKIILSIQKSFFAAVGGGFHT
jgi:hypothetical protein